MYAIRSYYDTKGLKQKYEDMKNSGTATVEQIANARSAYEEAQKLSISKGEFATRITSYNVCYTKLLRAYDLMFVVIGAILLFIFQYNKVIDAKKFITDVEPYFRFLMEDDYKFLLNLKYNGNIDEAGVNKLYKNRIRNGLLTIVVLFIMFLSKMSFIYLLICIIGGYIVFKLDYQKLKLV